MVDKNVGIDYTIFFISKKSRAIFCPKPNGHF